MPLEVPEFSLYAIVNSLAERLKTGAFWSEQPENYVFGRTVPHDWIDGFRDRMKDRRVRVGFIVPATETELPSVTFMAEDWSTAEAVLGEVVEERPETQAAVMAEVLVGAATAGQATAILRNVLYGIVPSSLVLTFNGVESEFASTLYSVNLATGHVTFTPALSLNDRVLASYRYYTDRPIRRYGELSQMTTRIFVEDDSPQQALMLSALVRRELIVQKDQLEADGIQNLAITVVSLSPWLEVLPSPGFRRELVCSYVVEQTAERYLELPRTAQVTVLDQNAQTAVDFEAILGYEDTPR